MQETARVTDKGLNQRDEGDLGGRGGGVARGGVLGGGGANGKSWVSVSSYEGAGERASEEDRGHTACWQSSKSITDQSREICALSLYLL